MFAAVAVVGGQLLNVAAKAAVDMAIWDALGRTLEQPVTELLGGYTDHMRVSHMVGFAPPEQMVAEAKHRADAMIGDARTRAETVERDARAKAAALAAATEREVVPA